MTRIVVDYLVRDRVRAIGGPEERVNAFWPCFGTKISSARHGLPRQQEPRTDRCCPNACTSWIL